MSEVNEVVEMATTGASGQNLFLILIVVIVAVVFIAENIQKFFKIFGLKTQSSLHEEEQNHKMHELERELESIKKEVDDLRSIAKIRDDKCTVFEHDVSDILKEIKDDLLQAQIEEIRYRILDFSCAIQKRRYTKEFYDNILDIYSRYEVILHKNNLTNGKVEMAIKFIKQKYEECLQNGFSEF